jgi:hypothetical protein
MADRLDVHAFRSSAKLPKGEEDQRRIRAMVYNVSKDDDAPFERLIDYWFAAIAWAVQHGLELPQDDSGGKMFVDIGRGGSDFILLESWRLDVLTMLYILGQPAFLADPFDPTKVDTTAGRFNQHGAVGGSEVIKNANRYALAGAMPMWEAFVGGSVDATKAPKQLAAARKLLGLAQDSAKTFRSTFASFGDGPREPLQE